ncbi:inositol monophosphatase 3 [Octopus bimaculoides]|uniref:inositol-phosphate phosphatase n=1 Tax=Octopus bimaculoides TaxID=37653 RepID=A0A0L8IBZ1_OCTBM|nr:inositol monophosphatase 3 [Octopus bimaculoides]|eukprot:XP_014778400.1 PREDICTED: inositol monophosphatase 3-like [Octopus bimaculoides]
MLLDKIKKMAPVNIRLNPFGAVILTICIACGIIYNFGLLNWFQKEERICMKELLSVSIELARRGGRKVLEVREKNALTAKVKGFTKEGAAELKTLGDMESHRAILYGMAKAFPGLKVISEEHETKPVDFHNIEDTAKQREDVNKEIKSDQRIPLNQIVVWIDPLDATQEYTEDLRQYVTTMVCVAVNGDPTIGVIHSPFDDQTYWAWVSYGHSSNLKPLEKVQLSNEKPTQIIVSRSHPGKVVDVIKKAFGENTVVVEAGGAGYKALNVVKGLSNAYVHTTAIKKWDICAGNAILNALNGKMTTLNGDYIDYSSKDNVQNDKGLLATMQYHYHYLEHLEPLAKQLEKKT